MHRFIWNAINYILVVARLAAIFGVRLLDDVARKKWRCWMRNWMDTNKSDTEVTGATTGGVQAVVRRPAFCSTFANEQETNEKLNETEQ